MCLVIQNIAITALLAYSTYIDIKERKVSNMICILIAIMSLLNFSLVNLLGIVMAFFVFIIALKTGEIGGGDVKIITALSLCLGLDVTMVMLFCAASAMLIFYLTSKIIKGEKASKHLPFVPFITLGYAISILLLKGLFIT